SSAGPKTRPRKGLMPKTSKNPAVARTPMTRSAPSSRASVMLAPVEALTASNAVCSAAMSTKLPADMLPRPRSRQTSLITTRRSGSGIGSGRSTTALTALKMAVVPPMPSASEALAACRRHRVKLCLPAELRRAPVRVDPAALFHPVERGIERPVFNLQHVASALLEPARNRVAVESPVRQRLEDERFERAVQE